MLKVSLTESGGLLPTRAQSVSVSSDALSGGQVKHLKKLVEAAQRDGADIGTGTAHDGAGYRFSIVMGDEIFDLKQSDANMTAAFSRLVDWIKEHAR